MTYTETVKHGHWIVYENNDENYCYCSECNNEVPIQFSGRCCINCGAILDGDVEHL